MSENSNPQSYISRVLSIRVAILAPDEMPYYIGACIILRGTSHIYGPYEVFLVFIPFGDICSSFINSISMQESLLSFM